MEITLAEFHVRLAEFLPDIQAGRKRAMLRLTAESKSTVTVGKAPEIAITGVEEGYGGYIATGAGPGVLRGENMVRIEELISE